MCNQPDQSLIGQCEHKITKGFLSHRIMWRSSALYMCICSFNPMCQIISKHLEVNFKNLLGMKYVPDVVFLVLWSKNNDWTIYVFAAGVGCKIRSVGSTEFRNIPYLSSRATCTINVMVTETLLLRLKIWILSFLEERKCCMIFLNKTLITLSHIVFNISLGLIYEQCHHLHANHKFFLLLFR